MTGTGTADDPYIVNSWEEYSGIGSNEVLYVEFAPNAENKVIDFNEICPEGFSKTVAFARYTNFNDWTLKNFHSTANKAIKTGIGGKIDNLNFENFCWYPLESKETYLFYDTGSIGLTMTNCTISGQIQALNKINYVIPGVLYESSLNIIVNTNNTFYVAKNFINSDIVLDISAKSVSLCYSNARKKALDNENRIIAEAKQEAASIIRQARNEAELEKRKAADDVKKEMISIAVMMAGKVTKGAVDVSIQDSLDRKSVV